LYVDLEDNEQSNTLLRAMAQILRELEDPVAINLATEIEQWLEGRGYHAQREYRQAVAAYRIAIRLNDHNPGTCFDRGRTFVGLKDYYAAQDDFENVIRLDLEWLPKVKEVIEGDPELFGHLGTHRESNPDLATHFPTLTPTPTPTNTPTPTPTPTPSPTNTSTPTATPTNTPTPTFTPRPPTPTFTPVPPTPVPTQPPRPKKTKPPPTQPPPTERPPTSWPRPSTPTPA
jgi:hypothetical protein